MNLMLLAAILGISGCAGIMKQDPKKLEDACKESKNKNAPMCRYLSGLKSPQSDVLAGLPTGYDALESASADYQAMTELERCEAKRLTALRKGAVAWDGLLAWRKKAYELKAENEKFAKGCP